MKRTLITTVVAAALALTACEAEAPEMAAPAADTTKAVVVVDTCAVATPTVAPTATETPAK